MTPPAIGGQAGRRESRAAARGDGIELPTSRGPPCRAWGASQFPAAAPSHPGLSHPLTSVVACRTRSVAHYQAGAAGREGQPLPARGSRAGCGWCQHHGVLQGVQRSDAGEAPASRGPQGAYRCDVCVAAAAQRARGAAPSRHAHAQLPPVALTPPGEGRAGHPRRHHGVRGPLLHVRAQDAPGVRADQGGGGDQGGVGHAPGQEGGVHHPGPAEGDCGHQAPRPQLHLGERAQPGPGGVARCPGRSEGEREHVAVRTRRLRRRCASWRARARTWASPWHDGGGLSTSEETDGLID